MIAKDTYGFLRIPLDGEATDCAREQAILAQATPQDWAADVVLLLTQDDTEACEEALRLEALAYAEFVAWLKA